MRKTIFTILFIFGITLLNAQESTQISQTEVSANANHFGIAIKGGTWGFGGDAIWAFHPKLDVRLGGSHLPAKIKQIEGNLDVNHDYELTQVNLLADYNVNKWFHLTAGVVYSIKNQESATAISNTSVSFGEITVLPDRLGTVTSVATWNSFSPYLGLGFGSISSPDKLVGFSLDLGAFYMGKPTVEMDGTGMIGPTANDENADVLSSNMSEVQFFPVLNISISFKIK